MSNEYLATLRQQPTATIANGATLSGAVNLGGLQLIGYQTDAGINSVAMTFQASADGVTYTALTDPTTGNAISHVVAASKYVKCNPANFFGIKYLKFVGGTAETGDTVITLDLNSL